MDNGIMYEDLSTKIRRLNREKKARYRAKKKALAREKLQFAGPGEPRYVEHTPPLAFRNNPEADAISAKRIEAARLKEEYEASIRMQIHLQEAEIKAQRELKIQQKHERRRASKLTWYHANKTNKQDQDVRTLTSSVTSINGWEPDPE